MIANIAFVLLGAFLGLTAGVAAFWCAFRDSYR